MTCCLAWMRWGLCMAAFLAGGEAAAEGKRTVTSGAGTFQTVHGSTEGLVSANPEWGAGVQIGNYGGTGLCLQKLGFNGGALNLSLGLDGGSIAVSADYLVLFTEAWRPQRLGRGQGYAAVRGQLTPYIGGGVEVERGIGLRVPAGLQYTMVRDPFNFFGGLAIGLGRLFTNDGLGPLVWFNGGVRLLL